MTRAAHFPRRRYPTEGFDSIRSRPSVRRLRDDRVPSRPVRSMDRRDESPTDRSPTHRPRVALARRPASSSTVRRPPSSASTLGAGGVPHPRRRVLDRSTRSTRSTDRGGDRGRPVSTPDGVESDPAPSIEGERSRESSRARSRQSINVFMRRVIVEYVYTSRSGDVIRRDVHHARPSAGRRAGLKFGDARTGGWMDGWMDG